MPKTAPSGICKRSEDAARYENTPAGRRLFWWLHCAGAVAHLSGIVVAAIVAGPSIDACVPLYAARVVARAAASEDEKGAVDVHMTHAGGLRVVWLVFGWFGCSLAFHLLVLGSWACGGACWYFDGMRRNVGPWRWAEYTISASIMLLAATAMLGTRELRVVVSSTLFIAVTMAFGYATELVSAQWIVASSKDAGASRALRIFGASYELTRRWAPSWGAWRDRLLFHVFGYVPFVAAWWLAFDSLYAANGAWVEAGGLPADAADALWAGFGLFLSFGFVQLVLQLTPSGPSLYWIGELVYCVLSVAAKYTMAMLLLFRGLTKEALAASRGVEICLVQRDPLDPSGGLVGCELPRTC